MKVVWPSAARALEILRGSKVSLEEAELPAQSSHSDRHKRSAEQPLNDTLDRDHLPSQGVPHDYLDMRSPSYNTHFNTNGTYQSTNMDVQSNAPSASPQVPYTTSYDRWPADNSNSYSFNGPLSTSTLPQLYNSGLVDERASSVHQRVNHQPELNINRANPSSRYPQLWNDYSNFPQLGSTYSTYNDQTPVPQQQQPSLTAMYIPENYHLYSWVVHLLFLT